MPLTISDDVLHEAGLNVIDARIEFACRLFDAGKLTLWSAAKLAGQDRITFEAELGKRHIPIYRPTVKDLTNDLAAFQSMGI